MSSLPGLTNDPSYDLISSGRQPLESIFTPGSVAVIGATEREGSVGRTLLWNLISNPFGGTVYPVNPKRPSILGVKAYPTLEDVPEVVDLAVIATPAPTVPSVIASCVGLGIKSAVIISAGFREIGAEGERLEQEILKKARQGGMRIIGPNCLGVMRPPSGLNATFAGGMALPGNVGFISQSGALLTSILDWSLQEKVGFSAFVSVGSMLDVDWGDVIYYLGDDPHTQSILIYMESIGNARSFLSAAREVTLRKPIIVIKAGRTAQAAQAAASHTGTLAGSDAVLDAAFRRTGVLRVDSIADLFYMAEVLSKQPRPKGPSLTIVTNAGGPGVLATDALITGGGKLAELSEETVASYNAFLPPHWSHANPVDILGDADPKRYAQALKVAGDDANSDGLLVVLTPQAMTDPTRTAEALRPLSHLDQKPVLASWMGGGEVLDGVRLLNAVGIPTFAYPDTAARVFNYMWKYSYNVRGLYETPSMSIDDDIQMGRDRVKELLHAARTAGRSLLTEYESKVVLDAYGIPTVKTLLAATEDEAVAQAEQLGYPVVLKLHSLTVTHKTDVGGVRLNLGSADAVREAYAAIKKGLKAAGKEGAFDGVTVQPMVRMDGYELIVGSSLDPQFGPVLLFGSGGTMVEVYKDRALALPPLNTTLARRMIEQTRIFHALQGVRGREAVDLDALEKVLVRFSQLVVEHRDLREMDINPLLVAGDRIVALDARVVLASDQEIAGAPDLAIRPYPRRYMGTWTLKSGEEVMIRPIRPEDEPKLVRFHERLSEQSVYLRYASVMQMNQRIAHDRLSRLCFIDYDREMALVAETSNEEIIGVIRLIKFRQEGKAEFALLIQDDHQREGLGTELLRRIISIAQEEGIRLITADILVQNRPMQGVCKKLDFQILKSEDVGDPMVKAVRYLDESPSDG